MQQAYDTLDYPASPFDADTTDFYLGGDEPDLTATGIADLLIEPPDPETFDEAVEMGLYEAKQRSARTWRLGWLALKVPTEYGKKTLAVWANRIGISASTANKARWLAKGFPSRIVRKYPELSVEHFTVVRSLLPKEVDPDDPRYSADYEQIESLLKEAVVCEWSVNDLVQQVHPDRDNSSRGFSLAGEIGGEELENGGIIGIYVEGVENYRAWIEQLSSQGHLGLFMTGFFKEDDRE